MTGLRGNWPDHTIPGRVWGSRTHLQVISEKLVAEGPEVGACCCTPALTLDALATKQEWATNNKALLTKARSLSGHSHLLIIPTPTPVPPTQWLFPPPSGGNLECLMALRVLWEIASFLNLYYYCHNLLTHDSISYTHTPRPPGLCMCCFL